MLCSLVLGQKWGIWAVLVSEEIIDCVCKGRITKPTERKLDPSLVLLRPAGSFNFPGFVWVAVESPNTAKILLSTSVRAVILDNWNIEISKVLIYLNFSHPPNKKKIKAKTFHCLRHVKWLTFLCLFLLSSISGQVEGREKGKDSWNDISCTWPSLGVWATGVTSPHVGLQVSRETCLGLWWPLPCMDGTHGEKNRMSLQSSP